MPDENKNQENDELKNYSVKKLRRKTTTALETATTRVASQKRALKATRTAEKAMKGEKRTTAPKSSQTAQKTTRKARRETKERVTRRTNSRAKVVKK